MAACREGRAQEEAGPLFDSLKTYVVEHFNAEERLQQQHAYPECPPPPGRRRGAILLVLLASVSPLAGVAQR
jgi:hypothetical protein